MITHRRDHVWIACAGLFLAGCEAVTIKDFEIKASEAFEKVKAWVATRADHSPVLATIDGYKITAEDLKESIERWPAHQHDRLRSKEGHRQLLDYLIRDKATVAAAKKAGLDQGREYRRELQRQEEMLLVSRLWERLGKHELRVTEEEVERYYGAHRQEYAPKQIIHARWILLRSLKDAQKVEKLIKQGGSFEALARKFSIDKRTAPQGGKMLLEIVEPPKDEVEKTLLLLGKGQTSRPFKTVGGYSIVRKDGQQMVPTRPRQEIDKEIRQRLLGGKFEQWLQNAMGAMKVTINESQLNAIEF